MKLPIVSRKTLERVKNNLKVINDSKMEIEKNYIRVQKDFIQLRAEHTETLNLMEKQDYEIADLKKEVKRLKFLLTKNGVSYKKKEKKVKKIESEEK